MTFHECLMQCASVGGSAMLAALQSTLDLAIALATTVLVGLLGLWLGARVGLLVDMWKERGRGRG